MIDSIIIDDEEIYMTNDDGDIKEEDKTEQNSIDWNVISGLANSMSISNSIYNHQTSYGISNGILSGGGGTVYTVGSGGGYSGGVGSSATWANHAITAASPYNSPIWSTPSIAQIGSSLNVSGDTTINGELTVKGVKLSDRLDKIEERLGILRPNTKLEERWDELKELGDRYRELEKEIKEKEEIWDLLKK